LIDKHFRLSSPELLEARALLSGVAGVHSNSVFSTRSMLASSASRTTPAVTSQPAAPVQTAPAAQAAAPASAAPATSSSTDLLSTQSIVASADSSPQMSALTSSAPILNPLNQQDPLHDVHYTFQFLDLNGTPLPNNRLKAGENFLLQVQVEDTQSPPADTFTGLINAALTVAYDNDLASIAETSTPTFFGGFDNTGTEYAVYTSGSQGRIDAGALNADFAHEPPDGPQTLFRIQVHANAPGDVEFTGDDSLNPDFPTILFDPPDENVPSVPHERILYVPATLHIFSATPPAISITPDSPADEGAASPVMLFTVALSGAFEQNVSVAYQAVSGTTPGSAAVQGQDFAPTSGTIVFTPGQTITVVTVPILPDSKDEANETFSLQLSNVQNGVLPANPSATGTIVDDDPAPTVSINATSSALEGDPSGPATSIVFTVTMTGSSSQSIVVPYHTAPDTVGANPAIVDIDYAGKIGTITFAPDTTTTTQFITIDLLRDVTNERDETFNVVLDTPTNATISAGHGTGVATIQNDDGAPVSFVGLTTEGGVKVLRHSEGTGGAGGVDYVFEVTKGPQTVDPLTVVVGYSIVPGGVGDPAEAGADYNNSVISGTLTFAADSTANAFITVHVNNDSINEANESFRVVLTGIENAKLIDQSAAGIIEDDDPLEIKFLPDHPEISLAEGNPVPNNANARTDFNFTVVLTRPSEQMVTVGYHDIPGTAKPTAPELDYDAVNGTFTFAPNTTSGVITVKVRPDRRFEDDNETFQLQLTEAGGFTVDTGEGVDVLTATIEDDDDPPTATIIGPGTKAEGPPSGATTPFVFTVTLQDVDGNPVDSSQPISLNYHINAGTATLGVDYTPTSTTGSITFAPGQSTATITVPVVDDSKDENDETFSVSLDTAGAVNVTVPANTSATAIIQDNDAPPTVSISGPASVSEGNNGTTQVLYTISLSGQSSFEIKVPYSIGDGTGDTAAKLNDGDFSAQSGTVTFAPDTTVTTTVVTVTINGDKKFEAAENFRVTLGTPTNASVGANGTATTTINNDDDPPRVTISDVSKDEGDNGPTTFTFTVSLVDAQGQSSASGLPVVVTYATADGTAKISDLDYRSASGSLTFAPGELTKTISVTVNGDLFKENNGNAETFTVQLALPNPQQAVLVKSQGLGSIENGSDIITFTPSSISGVVVYSPPGKTETAVPSSGVTLTSTSNFSNTPVNLSIVTASDGSFHFGNLEPGTYTITFAQPSLYKPGTVTPSDPSDTLTSTSFTTTIGDSGGVDRVGKLVLTAHDLSSSSFSARGRLASTVRSTSTGAGAPSTVVAQITTAPDQINGLIAGSTSISGTGQAGAKISVVASDGAHSSLVKTGTVADDGTWTVDGIDVSQLDDGVVKYTATSIGPGNASIATRSISMDKHAPLLTSIATTSTAPTDDDTVQFIINFNESVDPPSIDDFVTTGTGAADTSIASVSGSGASYTVTVNTGANGTLGLSLASGHSVVDLAGNPLQASQVTSQTYTIDKEAPAAAPLVGALVDPAMSGDESWLDDDGLLP
jgi:hypothetical protein